MSYVALYRKYRPRTFDDVGGQEIVVKILKNSIINNKIGHAYIFSGTRGTGKTSVAKIFSRAINCLNPKDGDSCLECDVCKNIDDNCIDIIEIDAASNNGVDEIREIRNNVTLMPNYLKYKVYIIDEVHMLSGSAFNALLKTLEEPPEHVVFILATTELNKIPLTVLSRCQKIDFKKIPHKVMEKRLSYILKEEKKFLPDDVISLVAELSDGSFRDAINYIDQLIAFDKQSINIDDVYDLIGDVSQDTLFGLVDYIVNANIKDGLELINKLYDEGKNFYNISERLLNIIRDIIIYNNTRNYFSKEYESLLDRYSDKNIDKYIELSSNAFNLSNILKKATNQKTLFETYFIKMTLLFRENENNNDSEEPKVVHNIVNEVINKNENKKDNFEIEKNLAENDNKIVRINNSFVDANKDLKNSFISKYEEINDYLSNKEYNSISSLLLKATPQVVSNKNVLFSFKQTFEVVLFDKNIELIQKFIKKIYGIKYDLVAIEFSEWEKVMNKYKEDKKKGVIYEYISETKETKKKKNASELEKEAENIFGDEIVTVE